jgi:hypothetical protein
VDKVISLLVLELNVSVIQCKAEGFMRVKSIFFALVVTVFFSVLSAGERERTFSLTQEQVLARHPKVLSFLFHMTRNKLDFKEVAEKYKLGSVQSYYNFLLENDIIEELENGSFRFLFLNPYGVWALRTRDSGKDSIYYQLRQQGIERLVRIIEDRPVNLADDPTSAVWTVNTARLTAQQYQEYKQNISQICKKYTDLGEQNLFNHITDYQTVWMMHLAGQVDPEMASTSHLLFGAVEEFE